MKRQMNNWINHHKWDITITAIAVVSVLMLRHQARNNLITINKSSGGQVILPPQWVNGLKADDQNYAYLTLG